MCPEGTVINYSHLLSTPVVCDLGRRHTRDESLFEINPSSSHLHAARLLTEIRGNFLYYSPQDVVAQKKEKFHAQFFQNQRRC